MSSPQERPTSRRDAPVRWPRRWNRDAPSAEPGCRNIAKGFNSVISAASSRDRGLHVRLLLCCSACSLEHRFVGQRLLLLVAVLSMLRALRCNALMALQLGMAIDSTCADRERITRNCATARRHQSTDRRRLLSMPGTSPGLQHHDADRRRRRLLQPARAQLRDAFGI